MSFLDKLNNLSSFFGINDETDDFEGDLSTSQPRREILQSQRVSQKTETNNYRRPIQPNNVVAMNQPLSQTEKSTVRSVPKKVEKKENRRTTMTKSREDYLTASDHKTTADTSKTTSYQTSKQSFTTQARTNRDNRPKITIKQPRVYSDAMKVAEFCMNDEAVLVNFHYMEEYQARRVIDFLTGIAHALHGDLQRVGNQIFLLTPESIQIDGNEAKSLVNNHDFDYEI